jgi:glycosyltransferase involved in cell wall biosynthesis
MAKHYEKEMILKSTETVPPPILSICVPTFNRAEMLDGLLAQLSELSDNLKYSIQVCVSNNASTDSTQSILEKWNSKLNLTFHTQSSNIGASANCIEVTKLAKGNWVLIIGDDDRFILSEINKLLEDLSRLPKNTWVLSNVAYDQRHSYLEHSNEGFISSKRLIQEIILHGINRLGFLSLHIIPKCSLNKFHNLPKTEIQGWPQLALFFSEIYDKPIYLRKTSAVQQAAGGNALSWKSSDWLRLMMQRTHICLSNLNPPSTVHTLISIREYFAFSYLKQIISCKINNCWDLSVESLANSYVTKLKINKLAKLAIIIYLKLMTRIPKKLVMALLIISGRKPVSPCNPAPHLTETDGVSRGL